MTVAGYVHGMGGMQDHTTDLARGLAESGHEVEVVTARHPDGVAETLHAGARWHYVDAQNRYARLPMRHHAWLRRSADAFERLHAANPFDLVHSESTSALGLLRRGVHRTVPVVAKFHGNYVGRAKAAARRALAEPAAGSLVREAKHLAWISGQHFVPPGTVVRFRACEAMVPSRQQLEDTRRSYLLDRSRIHVVPNGVDAGLFRPQGRDEARGELGLDGSRLLVCVGRVDRGKGVHHAIAALERLTRSGGDVRLAIVGSGEHGAWMEELARARGVAANVLFAGRQPRERVAAYLAAADVVVFPTDRDEAAPLVLLQAMATAVPVVATRTGGIPEVLDGPAETGVLVPPGDAGALADAVAALLRDDGRRSAIGEAARRRVVAEYTLERMLERTLEIYRVARERHRARA